MLKSTCHLIARSLACCCSVDVMWFTEQRLNNGKTRAEQKSWRKRRDIWSVREKVVLLQLEIKDMKTLLIVFLIALGVVALMMAGLGLKMLLHKEKEFRRPCANADPLTGRCAHCTCGRKQSSSQQKSQQREASTVWPVHFFLNHVICFLA